MQNQKSDIGMDANVTALIGYPIGILELVLIFIEKYNKLVRFHAIQSVLWSVGVTIGIVIVAVIGTILAIVLSAVSSTVGTLVGFLIMLVYLVLFLALFGGMVFAAYKAYSGEMFKLPLVGGMAEKWA